MKQLYLFLVLCLLSINVNTQNLIKNPGFEDCNSPDCIPTDRTQIDKAQYWGNLYNKYDLNGQPYYYSDLFDNRTTINNSTFFKLEWKDQAGEHTRILPFAGIPYNFLTCGPAHGSTIFYLYSRASQNNRINNRYADLEAYVDPSCFPLYPDTTSACSDFPFYNIHQYPVNRALVGELITNDYGFRGDSIGLKPGCYTISFWAASPSYKQFKYPAAEDWHTIVHVSLMDDNGKEDELLNEQPVYGDYSIFNKSPICANEDGYSMTGEWKYYQAQFTIPANSYTKIVFKLNLSSYNLIYPFIPDIFIDDVGLSLISEDNPIKIEPSYVEHCKPQNADKPWFSISNNYNGTVESSCYQWQYLDDNGNWQDVSGDHVFFDANNTLKNGVRSYLNNNDAIYEGENKFRCIVTCNGCSTALTSNIVTLFKPPSLDKIVVTPNPAYICEGKSVVLTAKASNKQGTGLGILTYEWYKGTSPGFLEYIDGANSSSYIVDNISLNKEYYVCVISNLCSRIESDTIVVKKENIPEVELVEIEPIPVCGPVAVEISVTGTEGSTFYWFNSCPQYPIIHPKPTPPNNIFTTPVLTKTTTYYVIAEKNGCYSDCVPITATMMPDIGIITIGPDNICVGDKNVNLTTEASGEILPEATYQWYYKNTEGTITEISTNSSYFIGKAEETDAGSYWCEISNSLLCPKVKSNEIVIKTSPTLSGTNEYLVVYNNELVKLHVSPDGTGPFKYS